MLTFQKQWNPLHHLLHTVSASLSFLYYLLLFHIWSLLLYLVIHMILYFPLRVVITYMYIISICSLFSCIHLHAVSSSEVSSRPKSKPARPSPPPRNDRKRRPNKSQSSQNVLNKILKKSPLIRAKSMEDILSSVKGDYAEIPRRHSPPLEEETFKPTPPPLPPPRIPGSVSKTQNCVESTDGPKSAQATKPKTSYFKSTKNQKPVANGHLPSSSRRSASPPSTDSPVFPSDSTVSPQKLNKRQSSPDIHTKREQLLSQMIEKMQTKFIALHSYSNTKEGCLSFSAGELCTVKQKKSDGWWLVRIGDREGWTPGNYWKEESSVSDIFTTIWQLLVRVQHAHINELCSPSGLFHTPCYPALPVTSS